MALLQISEPGESSAPHQHRNSIGIDLGTTNSLVATVRSGEAVCLADEEGRSLFAIGGPFRRHRDTDGLSGTCTADQRPIKYRFLDKKDDG